MHEVDVSATILRHTRWENSRPTSQQLQYYHKAQQTACSILTFTHTLRCASAALRHTVLHSHTLHCAGAALRHTVPHSHIHCSVLALHCVTRCFTHTHTALCWHCTASHGGTFTHTPRCADAALRESHGTTFTHTLHGATCLAISSVCGYSLPDTVVSASTLVVPAPIENFFISTILYLLAL